MFCFKIAISDGVGGGNKVDNKNTMPEGAVKAVLTQNGVDVFYYLQYTHLLTTKKDLYFYSCSLLLTPLLSFRD